MSNLSAYAVVLFIAGTLLYGAAKRVDCFDTFAQGGADGPAHVPCTFCPRWWAC